MAPQKRLRTWSAFGDLRRVPTEYEIVTHKLHYSMRSGRDAALESSPASPMNAWLATYRDGSPLRAQDWDGFRDPDQITYRRYVTMQDEAETVVLGVLDEFSEAHHDATLAPGWRRTLATVFTPLRYPFHAVQQCAAYIGQIAPSSYVTNCAAFEAGDMLRAVSLVAYRSRELALTHPGDGFAEAERRIWETEPGWQPTRRALERALITYDWAEALTAVNLVLRPAIDAVLFAELGALADRNDDQLTWLLLANLGTDSERAIRWSTALATYAVRQRAGNADVLRGWIDRWTPRADAAAAGIADLLSRLPDRPADPAAVVQAAQRARSRVADQIDAGMAG